MPQRGIHERSLVSRRYGACEFVRVGVAKKGKQPRGTRRSGVRRRCVGERPCPQRGTEPHRSGRSPSAAGRWMAGRVSGTGHASTEQTQSRPYWRECKKAHARQRGATRAPQARSRGLASVSVRGQLGPSTWGAIRVACRRSCSRLARLGRGRGCILYVTNVVASLTRSVDGSCGAVDIAVGRKES